ncbi:ORF87 [Ranid herpesvirus 2]|uniref:ORF87 n=1 Tax=Ranid herpesvirus 2 TaxID=389214 RepID=Q14W19_9VIRU|nr:ORF87 [Ranid herpesvirus 2]ABG25703.1 ORF87 [Ranid herpesvirus 2]
MASKDDIILLKNQSCDPVALCASFLRPHEDPGEYCFVRVPENPLAVQIVKSYKCEYCNDPAPVKLSDFRLKTQDPNFKLESILVMLKYQNKLLPKRVPNNHEQIVQYLTRKVIIKYAYHMPAQMLTDKSVVEMFHMLWHSKYLIMLMKSQDVTTPTERGLSELEKLKAIL